MVAWKVVGAQDVGISACGGREGPEREVLNEQRQGWAHRCLLLTAVLEQQWVIAQAFEWPITAVKNALYPHPEAPFQRLEKLKLF